MQMWLRLRQETGQNDDPENELPNWSRNSHGGNQPSCLVSLDLDATTMPMAESRKMKQLRHNTTTESANIPLTLKLGY